MRGNFSRAAAVYAVQRSVPPTRLAGAGTTWDSAKTMNDPKRRFLRRALALTLCAAAGDACAAADAYRFDPVHTQVTVCVDHMGFSRSCGRLHVQGGAFRFDPDDWSTAALDVTVDSASIDMGDAGWSDKVRNTYLDAKTYPGVRFTGQGATKTGAKTAVMHGRLTLLGRTQPVDLEITFNRAARDGYTLKFVAGFAAQAHFKRSAFGSTRSAPDVGDAIDVHVEVEGLRDKDAEVQASGADHPASDPAPHPAADSERRDRAESGRHE